VHAVSAVVEIPLSHATVGDPLELGIAPRRRDDLVGAAARVVDAGLLPSCQLALARRGRLIVFETLGEATPASRYVIFSCTKALIAAAVWLLMGERRIDVTARVAAVIPEFETNGKDAITIEQLLTHTAGIPRAPLGPPHWTERATRLARFAAWRLNWEPGTRFEYHLTSAHWVLAELIERCSGMDYRRFVTSRITGALGLHGFRLGVAPEEQRDINTLRIVGVPPTAEEIEAVTGIGGISIPELTDRSLLRFNEPETRAVGVPGAGAVATAADVALFYQALLHNPGPLWDPDVLADGTGRIRTTLPDPMLGVAANRSLGLVIAGDDGKAARRGMPRNGSPGTFGHHGVGGQVAWADPASGISFCFLTNGLDANPIRAGVRGLSLSNRAAACAADA
jgi:CubicO group peptidase (beta-lactamase class C family)